MMQTYPIPDQIGSGFRFYLRSFPKEYTPNPPRPDQFAVAITNALEAAFSKFGNRSKVVTDGGHLENSQLAEHNEMEAKTGA
jgi:hypothetical protein